VDRNTEAFLHRKKAGGIDRLAMCGPARVLIRHFLNVPRGHRHEYYLAYEKHRYGLMEIEDLARQYGIEDQ
jgi:hypothetical protein